jgi:hypothetical protein
MGNMRKFLATKDKRVLVVLITLGIALIAATVILVRKFVLSGDAEECGGCEDEDEEYRDENGCCYTD